MIQRIQSIFLLVAIICNGLLFSVSVFEWVSPSSPVSYSFNVWSSVKNDAGSTSLMQQNITLSAANFLLIIMTIAVVFMYKNRKQQAKLCHLLVLLQLVLICLVMFQWDVMKTVAGEAYNWQTGAGIVFLILPAAAFLMARYFILKDEALVRSADRLR